MHRIMLLVTCMLVTLVSETRFHVSAESEMCFNCQGIPFPRDCDRVVKCGPQSKCYTEEYATANGGVLYNTGCRSVSRCDRHMSRRDAVTKDGNDVIIHNDDVDDDLVLCEMCCDGDYCNSHGCNSRPLAPANSRGPVCFDCHQRDREDSCDRIKVCDLNEQCLLRSRVTGNGDLIYTTDCMLTAVCDQFFGEQLSLLGRRDIPDCTGCCDSDYCNRHCSALQKQARTNASSAISTTASSSTKVLSSSSTTSATSSRVVETSATFAPMSITSAQSSIAVSPSSTTTSISTTSAKTSAMIFTTSTKLAIAQTSATVTPTSSVYSQSSTTVVQSSAATISKAADVLCRERGYQWESADHVCYKIYDKKKLPWHEARLRCNQDGGDLIVFMNRSEETHFASIAEQLAPRQTYGFLFVSNSPHINFWVGASDADVERDWRWVDGTVVDQNMWQPNQPDNGKWAPLQQSENCATLNFPDYLRGYHPKIELNDEACLNPESFICEIKLQELLSPDFTKRPCRNPSYTFNERTGICYKIYDSIVQDQPTARQRCQQESSDLLVLRNGTIENVFIDMHFNDHDPNHRYLVGASRIPGHNDNSPASFEWINGRPLDSTLHWYPGEPNNYLSRGEDCMTFTYIGQGTRPPYASEFALNDDTCCDKYFFICEEKCPNRTYHYDPASGLCFKLYTEQVTWCEAKRRCGQDNMDLLEIKSITQLHHFQGLLNGHDAFWIGAQSNSSSGSFQWLTLKHDVPDSFWQAGQPSAIQTEQTRTQCASLSHSVSDNKVAIGAQDCHTAVNGGFICQHIW